MMPLFYYLLKVTVCSGVLFLYYYAALRNKDFHQWNRFYLLISTALSLLLPLGFISFTPQSGAGSNAINLVYAANGYLQELDLRSAAKGAPIPWMEAGYSLVCLFFLLSFIKALLRIRKIASVHKVQYIGTIKFFDTEEAGTPFSFLHYLFWNKKIDLHSQTGQQIFGHELVHMEEKHTLDKLFMQLALIAAWANPFFWLIRKELSVLHEFIPYKNAAGQHGTAALAAMILQSAFPDQFHKITNPFFHSSIKRRFAMLTKAQKTRISYASRIAVLPLAVLVGFAFTAKPEKSQTSGFHPAITPRQQVKTSANELLLNNAPPSGTEHYRASPVTDTVPRKTAQKITVKENGRPSEKIVEILNNQVIVTDKEGKKEIYQKASDSVVKVQGFKIKGSENQPLIFVDGVEISKAEMEKISPDKIQSVSVFKGEDATKTYGERGKNGVILISLKKGATTKKESADPALSRVEASIDK
jgi:hypothetical protein